MENSQKESMFKKHALKIIIPILIIIVIGAIWLIKNPEQQPILDNTAVPGRSMSEAAIIKGRGTVVSARRYSYYWHIRKGWQI